MYTLQGAAAAATAMRVEGVAGGCLELGITEVPKHHIHPPPECLEVHHVIVGPDHYKRALDPFSATTHQVFVTYGRADVHRQEVVR